MCKGNYRHCLLISADTEVELEERSLLRSGQRLESLFSRCQDTLMCHLFAEPHLSHHYRRVLVVDDYADSAGALCMFLEAAAFEARACIGGFSAIEVAREFAPSVILLDIAMPGMSGFEVLQCLRAGPADNARCNCRLHSAIL